jgi:putative transposase
VKKHNKPAASAQASAVENQELFLTLVRDSLRSVAEQMLLEEVAALCGPSHYPRPGAAYRRAGSERGTCHAGGRREAIIRPRVRKLAGDGTEEEHRLASYAAMRTPSNNAAAVVTALQAGMSTRSQEWASEGVMSKSAASRHWIKATAAKITEVRERDLRKMAFFGLMLDGVCLGDGAVVVIALGLRATGEKVLLDFEVGASENAVVCTALVARLQRRGFGPPAGSRLLAVLDGAAALQTAVLTLWPTAVIQRCLVHKERNLFGYLRKGDQAEARRLWRRLRLAQGEAAGREALAALQAFLAPLNAAASASLAEAGDQLIALHSSTSRPPSTSRCCPPTRLKCHAQLPRPDRQGLRWRLETDQISRWTATALLHVERRFHRIKGHADLPQLLAALALP